MANQALNNVLTAANTNVIRSAVNGRSVNPTGDVTNPSATNLVAAHLSASASLSASKFYFFFTFSLLFIFVVYLIYLLKTRLMLVLIFNIYIFIILT